MYMYTKIHMYMYIYDAWVCWPSDADGARSLQGEPQGPERALNNNNNKKKKKNTNNNNDNNNNVLFMSIIVYHYYYFVVCIISSSMIIIIIIAHICVYVHIMYRVYVHIMCIYIMIYVQDCTLYLSLVHPLCFVWGQRVRTLPGSRYMYMYICIYVIMCIYTYVYIYIYTYIYIYE